jgi:hypothetical protein
MGSLGLRRYVSADSMMAKMCPEGCVCSGWPLRAGGHCIARSLCTLRSYFRSPWNVLDSTIVAVSLASVGMPEEGLLRAFRGLRALRIVARSKNIQVKSARPNVVRSALEFEVTQPTAAQVCPTLTPPFHPQRVWVGTGPLAHFRSAWRVPFQGRFLFLLRPSSYGKGVVHK